MPSLSLFMQSTSSGRDEGVSSHVVSVYHSYYHAGVASNYLPSFPYYILHGMSIIKADQPLRRSRCHVP